MGKDGTQGDVQTPEAIHGTVRYKSHKTAGADKLLDMNITAPGNFKTSFLTGQ